ncbi:hypothetical protein BG452_04360 [Streptomyces sp. CBMA123]|nr:hypothetical protein [Streptomyces sp. CBMA123]
MHMCVSVTEIDGGGYECKVRCPGQRRSSNLQMTEPDADHILSLMIESGMKPCDPGPGTL